MGNAMGVGFIWGWQQAQKYKGHRLNPDVEA